MDESLSILDNLLHKHWISLHFRLITSWCIRSENEEVGEFRFDLVVFKQKVLVLLVYVLVLDDQCLLLFVYNSDLINQEFSSCSLVIDPLLPCQSLICFQKLPLRLMNYLLELFTMSLQLHLVTL